MTKGPLNAREAHARAVRAFEQAGGNPLIWRSQTFETQAQAYHAGQVQAWAELLDRIDGGAAADQRRRPSC